MWSRPNRPADDFQNAMMRPLYAIFDWIERADLGGWAMLLPGIFLVAMAVLIPAHLDRQALQLQRNELARHVHQLHQTAGNYAELRLALARQDPQLIQRLAWRNLNLKPVGVRLVDDPMPPAALNRAMIADIVEPMPSEPMTQPPRLLAEAKLVKLATGPHRSLLLVGAGLLIGGGLLTSLRKRDARG
jgi:hypothetical protein